MDALDLYSVVTEKWIKSLVPPPKAIARYTKNLSLSEVRLISDYCDIISVFESAGNLYSSFTTQMAKADAVRVLKQVSAFNQPKGSTIFFCAADWDCSNFQIENGIKDYFVQLNTSLKDSGYVIGCYGNGAVCKYLMDNNLAVRSWLWGVNQSNGTAEFLASRRWSIHQHVTTHVSGVSVDPDDLSGNYGGWRYAEDIVSAPTIVIPSPEPPPAILGPSKADTVMAIQIALQKYNLYKGAIDSIWGGQTQKAIDTLRSM